MAAKTITGTWEEICEHQSELQGRQLSVTVLPEQEPEADDWIMQYAMKMKTRTPEEIEADRAEIMRNSRPGLVPPPGKTLTDLYQEILDRYPVEPETEEETRRLDEAIRELS